MASVAKGTANWPVPFRAHSNVLDSVKTFLGCNDIGNVLSIVKTASVLTGWSRKWRPTPGKSTSDFIYKENEKFLTKLDEDFLFPA